MRGFKDHHKLTMVGFSFDRSSGVPREDPEVSAVTVSLWERSYSIGVSVPGENSDTGVSRAGSGDWQVSELKG